MGIGVDRVAAINADPRFHAVTYSRVEFKSVGSELCELAFIAGLTMTEEFSNVVPGNFVLSKFRGTTFEKSSFSAQQPTIKQTIRPTIGTGYRSVHAHSVDRPIVNIDLSWKSGDFDNITGQLRCVDRRNCLQ